MNSRVPPPPPDPAYRRFHIAVLLVMAAALAVAFALPALNARLPGVFGPCASIRWFGRPCPLCGLTRAFIALLTGPPEAASNLNPLAVPAFALAVFEIGFRLFALLARRSPRSRYILRRADLLFHGLVLAGFLIYVAAFYIQSLLS